MSAPMPGTREIQNYVGQSLKMLRDSWLDLLKLSMLPLLFCVACISWVQAGLQASMVPGQPPNLPLMLGKMGWVYLFSMPLAYLHYCILRYVRDRLCNSLNPNIFSYWLPQKTLLGCIGLALISIPYVLLAMIPVIIGLIFLLLPGVALYLLVCVSMLYFYLIYLLHPEHGIFKAIQNSIGFTLQQWLPLLVYATLVLVGWLFVYFILMIPFMVFSFIATIIATMASFQPGLWIGMFVQMLASTFLTMLFSALFIHFFGLIYLARSGEAPATTSLPQTGSGPSVFSTEAPPLTSPLPPQPPPGENPPRDPGNNPWGS